MLLTGPWGSVSMPGVWATNVSGVGVRITSTVTTPYTGTNTMVVSGTAIGVSGCTGRTSPCRYGLDQPGTASSYTMTVTMKVELVKIATTVSTTADLSGYVFALSSIDKNNSNNVGNISAHMFSGTKFVLSTCTRTSPNPLIVDLPPLSAAQLSPPGTTGGNTPFSLDFTCATARNISLTMTDALNASTADDKLTISTGSASATGVKLQVLFNGTPIQFSSSSQAAGIPVGSSTGSNDKFTIPLTVRYISTGAVTPGSVNAAATFTLSYP
jgi:type 1 fimbria pilin